MTMPEVVVDRVSRDAAFYRFEDQDTARALAMGITFRLDGDTHPLCKMAAASLQQYLTQQTDWTHNFGLTAGNSGAVIGKMFGVLVVRHPNGNIGYLSAFSGKLANTNDHQRFVAPIFDGLQPGSFLNTGMTRLSAINAEIAALLPADTAEIHRLKELRKAHSVALQRQIHEQYIFLNGAGYTKSLIEIFNDHGYKQPPAGAGECAGPKLLQHAFAKSLEPLAIAEFWWGLSPKSATWKHGEYYQPCKEKCKPILGWMLS
ncbi:pseudouridylate synthase [Chitinophaga sp. sic0106]|uniref:pseudouridylate synthase n=1 Tax=Chitinophaga sp. sic0106 TaxID=2854785 RepID=UPI001C46907E|nr:pseudouridylate synthase [Chitinophaga sp. sic0106]MBV7531096.1 pseudouridylate synthase [Chitinophaga sp. sic0106]